MMILYFYIFQRGFEVLNAILQASVYVFIITVIVYYNMYFVNLEELKILLFF